MLSKCLSPHVPESILLLLISSQIFFCRRCILSPSDYLAQSSLCWSIHQIYDGRTKTRRSNENVAIYVVPVMVMAMNNETTHFASLNDIVDKTHFDAYVHVMLRNIPSKLNGKLFCSAKHDVYVGANSNLSLIIWPNDWNNSRLCTTRSEKKLWHFFFSLS